MENLGTTAQAKANVSEEKLHVYSGWRQYQEWRIDLVSRSENSYETNKGWRRVWDRGECTGIPGFSLYLTTDWHKYTKDTYIFHIENKDIQMYIHSFLFTSY